MTKLAATGLALLFSVSLFASSSSAQSKIPASQASAWKSDVLLRSVNVPRLPLRVEQAVRGWIDGVLELGDGNSANDKSAASRLRVLGSPGLIASLSAQRGFAFPKSVRREVEVIHDGANFVASPITFMGRLTREGTVHDKPHVYRLVVRGATGKVVCVTEVPYYSMTSVNDAHLMSARDLYDLLDQSDSIIRQYRSGYESRTPGLIADMMASDALTWTVKVDQSKALTAASGEIGTFLDQSNIIATEARKRDLPAYQKRLERVLTYYDSVRLDLDESKKRLYRHVTSDGREIDVLEYYQEFAAWKHGRVVYEDAGCTTLLLTNHRDDDHEGRRIVRKFWSFSGIVITTDSKAIVPADPDAMPVVSGIFE